MKPLIDTYNCQLTKRERINHYAKEIAKLVPALENGAGGIGTEIHQLTMLVGFLHEELK